MHNRTACFKISPTFSNCQETWRLCWPRTFASPIPSERSLFPSLSMCLWFNSCSRTQDPGHLSGCTLDSDPCLQWQYNWGSLRWCFGMSCFHKRCVCLMAIWETFLVLKMYQDYLMNQMLFVCFLLLLFFRHKSPQPQEHLEDKATYTPIPISY